MKHWNERVQVTQYTCFPVVIQMSIMKKVSMWIDIISDWQKTKFYTVHEL